MNKKTRVLIIGAGPTDFCLGVIVAACVVRYVYEILTDKKL